MRERQSFFTAVLLACLVLTALAVLPLLAGDQSSINCVQGVCYSSNLAVVHTPGSDINPDLSLRASIALQSNQIKSPVTEAPKEFLNVKTNMAVINPAHGSTPSVTIVRQMATQANARTEAPANARSGGEIVAEMPETVTLPDTGAKIVRQSFTMRIKGLNKAGTYSLLLLASDARNQLHTTSLVNVINGSAGPDKGSVHLAAMVAGGNGSASGAVQGYEIDFSTTPPQLAKLDLGDALTRRQSPKVLETKIAAQMSAGDHHLLFFKPGTEEVSALRIMK